MKLSPHLFTHYRFYSLTHSRETILLSTFTQTETAIGCVKRNVLPGIVVWGILWLVNLAFCC